MNAIVLTHAAAGEADIFAVSARAANRPIAALAAFCLFLLCLPFNFGFAHAAEDSVVVLKPTGIRADGVDVETMLRNVMIQNGMEATPTIDASVAAGNLPARYQILKSAIVPIPVQHDAMTEINRFFHLRRWTDGLPIIPPTPERVMSMLRGTDLPPDYPVATLEPMRGVATVEKIAINAVMAGCRPEWLPVLIAAVEVIGGERADLFGSSTTTSPDAPIIIASGPMIRQLGINDGRNTFGRGSQANSSIGRAFHLILHNVGGSWPGVSDMSSIGQPGEFVGFLAESPYTDTWDPVHVSLGLPAHVNAVTVATAEGFHGVRNGSLEPEEFLNVVADSIRGDSWPHRGAVIVVVGNNTGKMLEEAGWTRASMEEFIREKIKVPLSEFRKTYGNMSSFAAPGSGVPAWVVEEKDGSVMVSRPFIDDLLFVRAGGDDADLKNLVIPCWHTGRPSSREVFFPSNLPALLREAEDSAR